MDLDIKRVLAARPGEVERVELAKLTTVWGERLDCDAVLQEHPRPRLEREDWVCLNGWWDYAIVESSDASSLWKAARPPRVWDGRILVPFSPEAALSGVGRQVLPNQLLWYRKNIEFGRHARPARTLLHFGAVDYCCACYVNSVLVATHVGGYLPFDLDITHAVHAGSNVVELCVFDPSEQGTQLRGKQRIRRGNMWYTAQSGIWQTVWLERVSDAYVVDLKVLPDADASTLSVRAQVSAPGANFAVVLLDAEGAEVATGSALAQESGVEVTLDVPNVHLWEPSDPYLYGLRVTYGSDEAKSYAAFRTVSVEPDSQGVARFCLNHKPLFVRGILDQGYWPDGLMTAPSDEALVADIEAARAAGFNMMRKHIKIEAERWYWHCDRLGMLVWQDMVSGGNIPDEWRSANIPTLVRGTWTRFTDVRPRRWKKLGAGDARYREEWRQTAHAAVRHLSFHPCIASWIVFNESWGQFLSAQMTEELRAMDSTRPFVATSGWYDQGAGDYWAVHNYFRSMRVYKDKFARANKPRGRAFMIDEFGGLTYSVEGHTSVPTVYGYDSYDDVATWRAALKELLEEVDALEEKGLCGFTYTQLCDVEEETNGILTYDRRVNKLA